MYKQILVPLDGSTFAEAALPLALGLSQRTRAGIHLVSVVEPIPAFAYEEWEAAAREWSENYMENVAERIRGESGGEVSTGLRSGHVVETLLTEAGVNHADLIVMATHGRGALSRAWLGSVADAVMRQAKMPVLFVRPSEGPVPATGAASGMETILVPLDGSDLSEEALEHATELGELFGSAYHLTRVVANFIDIASPYLPYTVQMNQNLLVDAKASAAAYLEERADRMRRRGLRVTTSVAIDGQAGHGILSEAEAVGCDLIAMATHGRTGMGRLVLGSAADKVLRGTHLPLLLYRPAKVPAVKV